ncbi:MULTISPECIES: diacylglycerol/lipid kinase family protein [Thermomonospora]|uniref:YegS/Rv2252/BmrU family lipid kinase n=1 Tax=Thermomonospora cellulosilytica TaxID=1411118 RepID=A0A7W3R9G2_9ACTN|nr:MULTISPECIES: YegS/Rv2252/BmrU family lipid kinase [Thermomonospora]MBA9004727.1 YegS/Rv2252/BmrU family lipid kinase [Thermomonospora cellulosilytica]
MRSKEDLEAAIRGEGCRAVLVVNTRSRRGRRLFAKSRRLLVEAGLSFGEVHPVSDPARLPDVLRDVLSRDPDLVVVGGGDGTIAEAVSHLAQRDVVLGVLPLGTTNNFARSLELPVALPGAVQVLREGKVADVDVGFVAGRVFANMVSVGLSVDIAERVPHGLKRVVGRAAYGLTGVYQMLRHRPFRVTVEVDGKTYETVTHQLNVANGSHHSGRRFAGDASPDDRLLNVYRLGDRSRLRLAADMLAHMLAGPRRRLADDMFLNTSREVRVTTDPPLKIDVDGEIDGPTPVTIGLLPNALRVMVPQSFTDH